MMTWKHRIYGLNHTLWLGAWLGIGALVVASGCATDDDPDGAAGTTGAATAGSGGPGDAGDGGSGDAGDGGTDEAGDGGSEAPILRSCEIDSGFPGDELCIPAPIEGENYLRLHYGPSDYSDQEEVDRFILGGGEEATNCQKWTTTNEETLYWKGYYLTARTGTHHIIVYRADPSGPSYRNVDDGAFPQGDQRGTDLSFMVGAQAGLEPGGLVLNARTVAPEYEGWAAVVEPETRICYEAHYVNSTDEPLLRESWVKFDLMDKDDVDETQAAIFAIGGVAMAVAPGAHESVTGECLLPADAERPIEILGMSGHMHAAGQRQTVWKRHLDGTREKVYETFDWAEPLNALYDSVTVNPDFSPETKGDGATSGRLIIHPGEKIQWECEYINNTEGTLRFGNGAYDAEMCNVFGYYGPALKDRNGRDMPWRCFNLLNVDISE